MQIEKICIVDTKQTNPYFNLALEEYLLNNISSECYILYLWQNDNTIVIGQNQNIFAQCNVELSEKENVNIVRRLSGGGAVFHDLGNLNYTFFAKAPAFSKKLNMEIIKNTLKSFDIAVEESGRNDILIHGRKISGNAYYNIGERCYHHGTLLINCNLEKMDRLLYVDTAKWKDRGIDSVRSRVTNLQDIYPFISVESVKKAMERSFVNRFQESELTVINTISQIVSPKDTSVFAELVNKYASKEWVRGRSIRADYKVSRRFTWGIITLLMELDGDKICDIAVNSDALETDIILKIKDVLVGKDFNLKSIVFNLEKAKEELQAEREKEILKDIIGLFVKSQADKE